jgi:hypothetical protein
MNDVVRYKGLSRTAAKEAVATLLVDGRSAEFIAKEMGVKQSDIAKMSDDPMVQAMMNKIIAQRRASAIGRVTSVFPDAIDTVVRLARGEGADDGEGGSPVPHAVQLAAAKVILDIGGLSGRQAGGKGGDTNIQVNVSDKAVGIQVSHSEQSVNDLVARYTAEELARMHETWERARDLQDHAGIIEGEP